MEIWDLADISLPPMIKAPCVSSVDTTSIRKLLSKIVYVMTNLTALRKEAAILSRMIYKMDRKFRHDIGYRNLKKTNVALLKFLNFEFDQYVRMFKSVLPTADDDSTYLPTRQMLEYLLLKIQLLSKLLLRIITVSEQAAVYFIQRVKLGESHWMSVMPFSILSRIWYMSKQLLSTTCSWYNAFRPYLLQLQYYGQLIIPMEYVFPDLLDLEPEYATKLKSDTENSMNNLQGVNSYSIKTLPIIEPSTPVIPRISKTIIRQHQSHPDVGRPISRDEFINKNNTGKKVLLTNTKNVETSVDHNEDKVLFSYRKIKTILTNKNKTNVNSLDKNDLSHFIKHEEEARLNGKLCLTDHLGLMQWHSLKANFESIVISDKIECTSPRFLQYVKKIKMVWKTKCSIYK